MVLIHSFSNLEIASSQKEAEEEEMKRNWLELPEDVLSLIFLKLGPVNIIGRAQWVCTSWWKLSKQPHLFRSIHLEKAVTLFGFRVPFPKQFGPTYIRSDRLTREVIDRSCGQLVEFSVRDVADDGLLQYMSDKSGSLKCIRLVSCHILSSDGLIEFAKNLPQLEDFEIIDDSCITKDVIEAYGRLCPRLKSCRLNYVSNTSGFHSVVVAIAQNMPELRSLHLYGSRLTDVGLKAVLDGCPHLESLDLRKCFGLKFARDLKVRCGNLKVLRLPNDPTGDFEYKVQHSPTHDFSDSDSHSDVEYYGYDGTDYDYDYNDDYDWNYDGVIWI